MTCQHVCYASEFGSMHGLLARSRAGFSEFMPTLIETRLKTAYFDLNNGMPLVYLRSNDREIRLQLDGIDVGLGQSPWEWTADSLNKLLDVVAEDSGLRQSAIDLRNAIFFSTIEYVGKTGHGVPDALGESLSASLVAYVDIATSPRAQVCREVALVEKVVERVKQLKEVVVTAAEQAEECLSICAERHPDAGNVFERAAALVQRGLCNAGCLISVFVDVVVGFQEVFTEIVREVITRKLVCEDPPTEGIVVPFEGRVSNAAVLSTSGLLPIPSNAIPSGEDFKQLLGLLKSLLGSAVAGKSFSDLGDIAQCILNASWRVTDLRDLGYNGVGDFLPIGFGICFDSDCTKKLLKVGPKELVSAAGEVASVLASPPVLGAVKFSATFAYKIITVAAAIISYHALMVMGQILILERLGKLSNGVCLNHPTIVLGLGGILLGPLKIINASHIGLTPIIVTPR